MSDTSSAIPEKFDPANRPPLDRHHHGAVGHRLHRHHVRDRAE